MMTSLLRDPKLVRQRYLPWVFWLSVTMAASSALLAQVTAVPHVAWGGLWLILFLGAIGLVIQRHFIWAYVLMGVALGAGLMHERMLTWQAAVIPEVWTEVDFPAQILVEGIARQTASGWIVPARLVKTPSPALTNALVLLTFPTEKEPMAGEQWSVDIRLRASQGQYNPGGIDFDAWLFTQHIQAMGRVVRLVSQEPEARYWHWQYWRWLALQRLLSVLPAGSAFSGLSVALVLGETNGVTAEQWQVLRDTGTLHMAVVSGMHITLIAGFAWVLAAGLWKLRPTQHFPMVIVASVAALCAAILFALLAGLTIPIQRALLMLVVVLVGVWLKRSLHPLLTLSWALFLVLLWDISAVMQVGFWLSFIATAVLLWLLNIERGRWQRLLLVHIGMSILLAPLLLLFFNQIPTYSPLANLLASPIIEWLLVPLLLLIALLAWWLPSLASLMANWADSLWALVWHGLSNMASWPHAVLLLSPVAWLHTLPPETQRITVLDTGSQSLVVVWQGGDLVGNWLMGSSDTLGQLRSVNTVVLPSLISLGVMQLDGIVMFDQVSSVELGLKALRQRMAVEQVLQGDFCLTPVDASLPFHFRAGRDGTCWMYLNSDSRMPTIALTGQVPARDIPAVDMIIAPAPNTNATTASASPWWISPGKMSRHHWAVQRKATAKSGAISVLVNAQSMRIEREYRMQNHRFYHRDQE